MATNLKGKIIRVSGPVVEATGISVAMSDIVRVGTEELMGEVIKIEENSFIIQVYENTTGVRPGEPVVNTHLPLSVELGPGLLSSIYDGIQRPLEILEKEMGYFIKRGVNADGISHSKKWDFKATVKKGAVLEEGAIIGEVKEFDFTHKVMLPNRVSGKIAEIKSGSFTVTDIVGKLEDGTELKMSHFQPVRVARNFKTKLAPAEPLTTGQRVYDVFFPVAKGGVAALPGPFGAGKTVTQQAIAKWSDADIVIYVGCGERGNEMTEVLTDFPKLIDPKTGKALMERTVLIANTSNMPVAAREASIYVGITIAEYYRDQGLHVALMADSTSRWAEAMREISSRLEEMPGEEGYPAYLSTRLANFYERAGLVTTLNGEQGSITAIGAVSPAGGDFSEPVTQNTLRVAKCFWALDAKLAEKRHYWSINWLNSYSLYHESLREYFKKTADVNWEFKVKELMNILQEEDALMEIVQLVGSDSLPESQQITLEVAKIIREHLLQQNAFHEVDRFCPLEKSNDLIDLVFLFRDSAIKALEAGVPAKDILETKGQYEIATVKLELDYKKVLGKTQKAITSEMDELIKRYK
ncbi:MAG: V-type ATP synthase subunit A [Nanoarchaeales archaeon]|nr:V-type ATP synthase subunit A [Nanoarchaeales archaeon]